MRVFVIGATGVLGKHVIPRLLERGHEVRAVVRQEVQAETLRQIGVEAFVGDILDAPSLLVPANGCDAALHLATAIPKRGEPRDFTRTNAIRTDGTRNLLEAAKRGGVRRYIQQSIVFLYGEGTDPADESTPIRPETYPSAAEMEQMVTESPLDWCILRGGWFYGPLAGNVVGWREDIRNGSLRLPGDGDGVISVVHEVDMARAVVLATEQAPARNIFNVVDNLPVTYRELYGYVAWQEGAPLPEVGGEQFLPSRACRNVRIKQELGWAPAYPTYRSGLV